MTVAIALDDAVDIESYDGLVSFLTDHLELSDDTVAQLPSLIRLAEYRLNRGLASPDRETSAEIITEAGVQAIALPTHVVQVRQVRIIGDQDTGYPLEKTSPNIAETYDYAGRPLVYTVFGGNLLLGPVPDSAYTLEVRYQERLCYLTSENQTNWLIAGHADAYVYMCAATISLHDGNNEAASLYVSLANGVIEEINRQGLRVRGGPIRMRGLAGV